MPKTQFSTEQNSPTGVLDSTEDNDLRSGDNSRGGYTDNGSMGWSPEDAVVERDGDEVHIHRTLMETGHPYSFELFGVPVMMLKNDDGSVEIYYPREE